MTENNFRHHHAVRTEYIVIPIPVAGPDFGRHGKPPAYPAQRRQPWRPAQHPPSKAERSVRLLNAIVRQDQEVREFMERARQGA
jgi:hypothetical protein